MSDEHDFHRYILAHLGSPVFGAEIDSSQIDVCVGEAKDWYMGIVGQAITVDETLLAGTYEYTVPDDCDEVVDVIFERTGADGYLGFDIADVEVPVPGYSRASGGIGVGAGYSDLIQALQYRETARRVLSSDRDWEYNPVTRTLSISPTTMKAGQFRYVYLTNELDLTKIGRYPLSLMKQWALSVAFTMVAQMRTMFSDFPSASGSFTMNGDTLQTRAELMQGELEEKLKGQRPATGFFTE